MEIFRTRIIILYGTYKFDCLEKFVQKSKWLNSIVIKKLINEGFTVLRIEIVLKIINIHGKK